MTDAERVKRLDAAREAFEQIAGDEGITSEGIMAGGLATAFEVLASLVRTRTAPPEPQDVSDDLLARAIHAAKLAFRSSHAAPDHFKRILDDLRRVQSARASAGERGE